MIRKSNALNVLLVGLVLLATATSGVALGDTNTAVGQDEAETAQSVYLVFGADVGSDSLDEWVDEFRAGEYDSQYAESTVLQYQDVDQLNVDQQEGAVAISIDDGDARAIQRSQQVNANDQVGVADAQNQKYDAQSSEFQDVASVNVIFANGANSTGGFSGIVVDDGSDDADADQFADANVVQYQDVDQANFNNQSSAVAIAANDSNATAYQRSFQENVNRQYAVANATNVDVTDVSGDDKKEKRKAAARQAAEADVAQFQNVSQTNVNLQGTAVAIAVNNSSATAIQETYQRNANEQLGVASATNVGLDAAAFDTAAMAAASGGDAAAADAGDGDGWNVEHDDGRTQLSGQESVSTVSQYQNVSQENVNEQNLALAVALNNSSATSLQSSYQYNENAQVGTANATSATVDSRTMSMVIAGAELTDRPGWAIDYDDGSGETTAQRAWADLEQSQSVEQLNFNQQSAAVSLATDGGTSSSFQISEQTNENLQNGSADAGNVGVVDPCADKKGAEKKKCEKKHDKKKHDKKSADKKSADKKGADETTGENDDGASDITAQSDDDSGSEGSSNAENSESSDEGSTDTEDESEDSLPGFGIGVAVLSLLAAVGLARRRA